MNRRLVILLALMGAAVLVRVFDPFPNTAPEVVKAVRAERAGIQSVASLGSTATPVIRWPVRERIEREPIDVFSAPPTVAVEVATQVPPPAAPPPPPALPPPPAAPPLPYVAIGDWTEDGRTVAFLGSPQGTVLVRPGDLLGNAYHVDVVRPGFVQLTYVPLKQTQQLTWGTTR